MSLILFCRLWSLHSIKIDSRNSILFNNRPLFLLSMPLLLFRLIMGEAELSKRRCKCNMILKRMAVTGPVEGRRDHCGAKKDRFLAITVADTCTRGVGPL